MSLSPQFAREFEIIMNKNIQKYEQKQNTNETAVVSQPNNTKNRKLLDRRRSILNR